MRVTKKIFIRTDAKKRNYQVKWFLLKNYSNSTFFSWKTKSPIFFCLKGKKCKFVRINSPVEIFQFVCVFFWNKKYIFSHTFDLRGRVGDKTIFTQPISGNKTTFFWPNSFSNPSRWSCRIFNIVDGIFNPKNVKNLNNLDNWMIYLIMNFVFANFLLWFLAVL